ncbi:TPA: class I SAM-dependent methyltransferase [Salmonella enterica]|uniref:Class I SAM-dependent methyltransferase n=1 Tax=Salmonella enterica TaxID=28901 RepID=A0A747DRU6_SALER|nr:class I SAM-dependent methyltransferase [Salmonella enterica]HAF4392255.1 class I SAM-dependent methyltransferase [Salmonella enterica]HAF6183546.1 class I SAM-dependent methyltransferase [Salmonella enterica]
MPGTHQCIGSLKYRRKRMQEHIPLKEGRALFGRDTNAYEQGRPDYPLPIFALLKEYCGPEICRMAFEIGPGTGQATEHLLDMGYQVKAVEPDHNLAIRLKERLSQYSQDSFSIINSTFEEAILQPGCFDLGIAATSFHWIEPVSGLKKIFQLLRPGGWFAMWWNVFGDPHNADVFMKRTEHLFAPLSASPSHKAGHHYPYPLQKRERQADLAKAGFTGIISDEFRWEAEMDARQTRQLISTFSPVARLSEAKRKRLLNEIERVVKKDFGGKVRRNFVTAIYLARKP